MQNLRFLDNPSALLRVSAAVLGLNATSCAILEVRPCSDLEDGEELVVTIQGPIDDDECDPALGLVSGEMIHLSVQEDGQTNTCGSKIGPTTIPDVDLTYQATLSADASGTDPFVSASDVVIGSCEGTLVILLKGDGPVEGAPDTFSRMRVRYYPVLDETCPTRCDLDYAIDVARM